MLDKIIDNGSSLYWTSTLHFGGLFNGDNNGDVYKQIRSGYLHPHFTSRRTRWGLMKREAIEHQLWDI